MPDSSAKDRSTDCRILQTVEESAEAGYNAVHNFFIVFCSRGNELEFLVFHFRVRTTAPVDKRFHLGTHGIEINRSSHDDDFCFQHFPDDFCCIIILRSGFFLAAAYIASYAGMNYFVAQENFFYLMAGINGALHKFVTK